MFTNLLSSTNTSPKRLIGGILLEIFIIILGVLLSLWISNLFERTKENRREQEFLQQLRADLATDLSFLQRDRKQRESQVKAARDVLRVLSQEPTPADALNIVVSIRELLNSIRFNVTNPTFRSLESTGQLELIRNDTLVNGLIQLYSSGYDFLDHNNDDVSAFRDNFLLPYTIEYMDFKTAFGPPVPGHTPKLEGRDRLFNMAAYLNVSLDSTVGSYKGNEQRVARLLAIIDREL